MTRVLGVVLVCAFVVCSLTVSAQGETGNDLLNGCQMFVRVNETGSTGEETFADGLEIGKCFGIVKGVMDAHILWQDYSKRSLACLPDELRVIQAVKVFIKYLEDNPEQLHLESTGLAWVSLVEAFPCPR